MSAVAVSRALGPEGKGTLSLATAIPGIMALVFGMGIGTALTIGARERWLPVRFAAGAITLYAVFVGFGFAAIAWLWVSGASGGGPSPAIVLAATASIGGLLLADAAGGLLQGIGRVRAGMWLRQAVGLGQSTTAIVLILFGVPVVLPILVAIALWTWGCGGAGIVLIYRAPSTDRRVARDRWWAKLVQVGIRSQFIWILLMLNYRQDVALLGALGSVADVGVYSVAVGFSEVAWFGVNALVGVLLPHLSAVEPNLAAARAARSIRASIAATLALSLVVLLGSYMLAARIFGEGFARTDVVFAALIPGLVTLAAFKIVAVYAVASRRVRVPAGLAAFGLLLNLGCNFLLIPPLGSLGAGISSSVSYSVIAFGALVWFIRTTAIRPGDVLLPTQGDILGARRSLGRLGVR